MAVTRCEWCNSDPIYQTYHDKEWGRPIHDDRTLFEFLILEGAQAGLNWLTILKKREGYRAAFDQFNPEKIARYDADKINELVNDNTIIRNRRKINATVRNAQAFLSIVDAFGSFDQFIWRFTGYQPQLNDWKSLSEVPTTSYVSESMSRELKKQGFCFVGPIICYAYMQAVGMVNDHTRQCFLYHRNNQK